MSNTTAHDVTGNEERVEAATPAFTVTKGNPTDEEIGAAMTVLAIALAPRPNPRAASDRPVVGGWNSYHRVTRREHITGPGAWTARW